MLGEQVISVHLDYGEAATYQGYQFTMVGASNDLLLDKLPDILDKKQKSNKVRNLLQSLKLQGVICIEGRL